MSSHHQSPARQPRPALSFERLLFISLALFHLARCLLECAHEMAMAKPALAVFHVFSSSPTSLPLFVIYAFAALRKTPASDPDDRSGEIAFHLSTAMLSLIAAGCEIWGHMAAKGLPDLLHQHEWAIGVNAALVVISVAKACREWRRPKDGGVSAKISIGASQPVCPWQGKIYCIDQARPCQAPARPQPCTTVGCAGPTLTYQQPWRDVAPGPKR